MLGSGAKELVDIAIDANILTATAGHPSWVVSRSAWIDAKDLAPGDLLLSDDGTNGVVESISSYSVTFQTVNNLTLQDIHTYFVVVDDDAVLVHNCGAQNRVVTKAGEELRGLNLQGWRKGKGSPHYNKHGKGMGYGSVKEYTDAAAEFAKKGAK